MGYHERSEGLVQITSQDTLLEASSRRLSELQMLWHRVKR